MNQTRDLDTNDHASPVRVKVCGITRAADARALDDIGVDYLGFNFWPGSKRYITPEAAAPLIASLRHAVAVGVFVDHTPEEIKRITALTGIAYAQLHGHETWDTIEAVELPIIKAISQTSLGVWGGLREGWGHHVAAQPQYFLVDTATAAAFGGTGVPFDWAMLGDTDGSPTLPRPLFLAGGLGPHNLAQAVRIARPFGLYAVDLNSKVETAPGVKDIEAVQRCMAIMHDAESDAGL